MPKPKIIAKRVKNLMKMAKINFIDNSNITDKHLERRGLHLNAHVNTVLVKTLLNIIIS